MKFEDQRIKKTREHKGILNITDPDVINTNITEKLTDTERYIIQILLEEEDISAPKIQKRIKKNKRTYGSINEKTLLRRLC